MSRTKPNTTLTFVSEFEGDVPGSIDAEIVPDALPVLPTRDIVMFPCVATPIQVGRKTSLRLVRQAERKSSLICVATQLDPKKEHPGPSDIHPTGCAARVVKIFEMPDGTTQVIIHPTCRVELTHTTEHAGALKAEVRKADDIFPTKKEDLFAFHLMCDDLRERAKKFIDADEEHPLDPLSRILHMKNDFFLVNFISSVFPFNVEQKIALLAEDNVVERTVMLLKTMSLHLKLMQIHNDIQQKTQVDINSQQREYFLQQQIRNIQEELGEGDSPQKDSDELRAKAATKQWDDPVKEVFERELGKLERIHPQSPDYNVQLTYLQTMLQLPWNYTTTDSLKLKRARQILDHDHYGMEKVKERILEHLAVMQLRGDLKSPITCLYGPPGVGKTSLGRSIAESLKRKYVRVSLGGLHDESEIRGHRRTYIGAMPGRVVKSIIKAGASNPVFVLDEIDKITQQTVNGDPASALLEVLDPEQNVAFHDNYLDIDYDLSRVLFIATANNTATIPQPLLDRMELIEVTGYCTEEKVEIARRHLIPKQKEENGLKDCGKLSFSKTAIETLIENYTRESGVRALDKQISKVCRKLALKYATDGEPLAPVITPEVLEQLLGKALYTRDRYQDNKCAGVVTGLAWTAVGGEILFIETSLSRGKGSKLTLTGNLGDVMKESAVLALEYIKAHAYTLGIDIRVFDNWNIHLHVPEGAVPKDGPSAGITMATSLASALTQRKVRAHVAMTGEITLRGKVLPVGGIKEKILAAKRAGITDILICRDNQKDIAEIPEMYVRGLTFHYVDTVLDVWQFALLDEKVEHPIDFTVEEETKAPADKL